MSAANIFFGRLPFFIKQARLDLPSRVLKDRGGIRIRAPFPESILTPSNFVLRALN